MPNIEFKQYGLYRTGTCLVKLLVERHLDRLVHSEALGNKHEGFNKHQFDMYKLNRAPHIKLLISIKNPYSWITSFAKWTMKDGVFTDEIDRLPRDVPCEMIKRWCNTYNYLYDHWTSLPYENFVVKYEDLVVDCRKPLEGIRKKWGLKFKSFPNHIDFIIRPGQEVSYKRFDFSYYYESRYILELSDKQIETVKQNINWDFLSQFGYTNEVPVYTQVNDYQI